MKADGCVLGMDIGGTHVRAGTVKQDMSLHGFEITPSISLFRGAGNRIQALAGYVRKYCARHLDGMLPKAVAVGFPSTVDRERMCLLSTPNLKGFDNMDVVEPLQRELGIPVCIDRDVNLLLLNDIRVHGLENAEIVIGCYVGTGLGNAICIRGEMLRGKNGVAGELGHIPIWGSKRPCGCGNIGCMETAVSGRHLEELRTRFFPSEKMETLFQNQGNDPVLREYVEGIAVPVAAEINIFDPDCVVLGGGVLQMGGFPMELLLEAVKRHTRRPLPYEALKIVPSSQSQESGVLGAGMCAWDRIKKGR